MRRRSLGTIAVLAGALLAATVASTAPATAAPGVTMTSLSLSSSSVSLRGEQVAALTVTVHLTDPQGVEGLETLCSERCLSLPAVTLTRVDGAALSPLQAQQDQSLPGGVSMHLVSGTSTDGTYQGTVWLTAAQAGDLTVGCVLTLEHPSTPSFPLSTCTSGADLPSHPVVSVTASDRPLIQVVSTTPARSTATLKTFTARVRAITSATHQPLAHRHLLVCTYVSPNCYATDETQPPGVVTSVTTDAQGYATVRMPFRPSAQDAVALLAPGAAVATHPARGSAVPAYLTVALASVDPQTATAISVTAAPRSVRRGSAVTLSGSVTPCRAAGVGGICVTAHGTVLVQRWVHRSWVTVGTAYVRLNARWTYALVPQGSGVHSYRAWFVGAQRDPSGRWLALGSFSQAVAVHVT